MTSYVAAIDQGTSSTRVMVFDKLGQVISIHQKELTQIYPQPGQTEQDPFEIYDTVVTCLNESLGKLPLNSKIECLGITNQRETTIIWNRFTGQPYHNAIVWNDTRTASTCETYSESNCPFTMNVGKDRFRYKTGLPLSTYFSFSKVMYLLDTVPGLREDADNGKAVFGTVDCWLIWKLTNGQVHATDVTNASRTFLFNIHTLIWDRELLRYFQIPDKLLPNVKSSSEIYGEVTSSDSRLTPLIHGVSIAGVLGDQHAALFGQSCFTSGEAKCTYGTGAFLLMNTGTTAVHSNNGLLTTLAFQLGNHPPVYALEGSVAYCGSTIQWLRDNLGLINDVSESEAHAATIHDNGGVFFVPAFAGLFAPYWRDDARGLIIGLTAYNTKAHICRAALEASAFQVKEIVDCMITDSGIKQLSGGGLKVDGGLSKNSLTMQFQADVLQTPLSRPVVAETTSIGVAFAAGLAVGYWKDLAEVQSIWHSSNHWVPLMDTAKRDFVCNEWSKAVLRSFNWVEKRGGIRSSLTNSIDTTHTSQPPLKTRLSLDDTNAEGTATSSGPSVSTKAVMLRAVPPSVLFFSVILGLSVGFIIGTNIKKN